MAEQESIRLEGSFWRYWIAFIVLHAIVIGVALWMGRDVISLWFWVLTTAVAALPSSAIFALFMVGLMANVEVHRQGVRNTFLRFGFTWDQMSSVVNLAPLPFVFVFGRLPPSPFTAPLLTPPPFMLKQPEDVAERLRALLGNPEQAPEGARSLLRTYGVRDTAF